METIQRNRLRHPACSAWTNRHTGPSRSLSITEHNHDTKTQQALSFDLLAMSAQDFDPGQLSESQQLALGTYTSVTNQEPSAAIPLLQRSEWNVQVCRRKRDSGVFGGLS